MADKGRPLDSSVFQTHKNIFQMMKAMIYLRVSGNSAQRNNVLIMFNIKSEKRALMTKRFL